jgi:hypothetical protein
MRKEKLAVFLSLLLPGVGHLCLRRYPDAAVFLASAGILWLALWQRAGFLFAAGQNHYLALLAGGLLFVHLAAAAHAFYIKTK